MAEDSKGWKWFARIEAMASFIGMVWAQLPDGAKRLIKWACTMLGVGATGLFGWLRDIDPWFIGIGCLLVFVLIVHFWHIVSSTRRSQEIELKTDINTIVFQSPLLPAGWKFGELKQGYMPSLKTSEFAGRKCLTISNAPETHSYCLDHEVMIPTSECGEISFVVRDWNKVGVVYIRMHLAAKDDSRMRLPRWFVLDLMNPRLANSGTVGREWVLPIHAENTGEGWHTFRVNMPHWLGQTFGKEGARLLGVEGFRLRGEMSIASIGWGAVDARV